MIRYFLLFACALFLVVIVMPLVMKVAVRWGFIDRPSQRKVHLKPLPTLGGLAIYLGCIGALVVFDRGFIAQFVSILLGATFVSFLGVWDDYRGLKPIVKFAGQVIIAGAMMWAGVKIGFLQNEVLNGIVTILWIVTITNALNLLDNMDGLSGGVAVVVSTFFLLLAITSRQYLVASLSAVLLGACLGFLFYNFNPASIFMGDSGSLFIGFFLAILGIKLRFPSNTAVVTWMIPVILLALPLFDTTLVVLSRLRRGVNPFSTPGKDHVSHRLVALGATHREAVLILYLVCCGLGVMAMFLVQATLPEAYTIFGALAVFGLYALWRLEKVKV